MNKDNISWYALKYGLAAIVAISSVEFFTQPYAVTGVAASFVWMLGLAVLEDMGQ